jgi:hypothetical protein
MKTTEKRKLEKETASVGDVKVAKKEETALEFFEKPEESFSDLRLDTKDGASFYVHRVILASCFGYWKARFTSGMNDATDAVVSIPEYSAGSVRTLLILVYRKMASGLVCLGANCSIDVNYLCEAASLAFYWSAKIDMKRDILQHVSISVGLEDLIALLCDEGARLWIQDDVTFTIIIDGLRRRLAAPSAEGEPAIVTLMKRVYTLGKVDNQKEVDAANESDSDSGSSDW